jgi:hypothetical protein
MSGAGQTVSLWQATTTPLECAPLDSDARVDGLPLPRIAVRFAGKVIYPPARYDVSKELIVRRYSDVTKTDR